MSTRPLSKGGDLPVPPRSAEPGGAFPSARHPREHGGASRPLLVVGSVALDSVETPFGKRDDILGGSATFFSVAASFFTRVQLVAVVGEDFPEGEVDFLRERGVDVTGLRRVPGGKTFRWAGRYSWDLNTRETLDTQLNVFAGFEPELPPAYRETELVFLANIDPVLQRRVLGQVRKPLLVACDTMNFWIEGKPEELRKTLGQVHVLVINDGEARELAREHNLVKAARIIRGYGPRALIVKRGEYGALLFDDHGVFAAPAFPVEEVFDPTGAGDAFAGGFMGSLSREPDLDPHAVRRAVIYGSVLASFAVEDFSLDRLRRLTMPEVVNRFMAFQSLTQFAVEV